MRSVREPANPAIAVFTSLNFVLAGLCGLGVLGVLTVLVYGIFFSGDQGEELAMGVIGCVFVALIAFTGFLIYLMAGIGMARRRPWGYYLHCIGAVLAGLTLVGGIYTVFALMYAFRPEFSGVFLEADDRPRSRRIPCDDY
jgi:hypothetical protein